MKIKVFYRYTEDGPEFIEVYENMYLEQTTKIVNFWNSKVKVGDYAACRMLIVWG